jgi:hypothetical protein
VGPESAGGDFKAAGKDVERGGEGVGHEMKQGKPIAAGKDLGEGVGKGGKKVGKGVKKAVFRTFLIFSMTRKPAAVPVVGS